MTTATPLENELERLRKDTPGCAHVAHFNNAGAALMPLPVIEAQHAQLELEAHIGGYEAAAESGAAVQDTRVAIGEMLGAAADEISLVENATRGWGAAFYGLNLGSGDRVLTARASYASNYIAMLQVAQRAGVHIDVAPDDGVGRVDVEGLERMITPRTRVIAITHVPTNGGLINPAEEIGAVARAHGIPYLLDACQSVGQLDLNVDRIGCDMLSAAGRKYLRGPRGTGFLYVRGSVRERLEPPFLDLHAAEWTGPGEYVPHSDRRRFETWEGHIGAKVGLGVAVRYAMGLGLDRIEKRVQAVAEDLRAGLRATPGVSVHDKGDRKSGIVTFSHHRHAASDIVAHLRKQGVNTNMVGPSSTLLDASARALPDLVRASVHYYNSDDEIERLLSLVGDLSRSGIASLQA